MSELAQVVKIDPVSVVGLEDVFDLEPVPEGSAAPVTGYPEHVTHAIEQVPTNANGVPVEQAAAILGTSGNALKKRLRKGTLKGVKVETKHGEKWFVDSSELPQQFAPVTRTGAAPVTGTREPVTDISAPVTRAFEPVPTESPLQLVPALDRLVASLEKKDTVIESQAHQLKAAGDVIMYLRSQLEEKDDRIKLLTDSQHKPGWWSRFCSWFKS